MPQSKKILFSLMVAATLSACSLNDVNPSSLPQLTALVKQYAPDTRQIQTLDVNPQAQTGGAFILSLKLNPGRFQTQDSMSGNSAKNVGNISKFRVFLYKYPSLGPVPSGSLTGAGFVGPFTLDPNIVSFQQDFLLKNVPAGNYYVGIAAFNDSSNFNEATNITSPASNYFYSEGPCYLSNGGGESPPNAGRVTIDPDYTISAGAPQLQINLDLESEKGARLDTQIKFSSGLIFYAGNNAGNSDIYSVEQDGAPETSLAFNNGSNQTQPRLKPVSPFNKIAYVSNEGGPIVDKIFVANIDGSSPNQLTSPVFGVNDREPAWQPVISSPLIAFTRFTSILKGDIYTIPASGGLLTNLTDPIAANPLIDDKQPAWNATGSHIAYISDFDGNYELWVMEADGDNPQQLTTTPDTPTAVEQKQPSFNINDEIVYVSDQGGDNEIWVTDITGSNPSPSPLTTNGVDDHSPAWSPDGSKIAWVSDGDIWAMDSNGNNKTRLTYSLNNAQPVWTPEGQIMFVHGFGSKAIYLMTGGGQAERQISSLFSSGADDPGFLP